MAQVPVAEGIFTMPSEPSEEPELIGSRCAACGIVTFPAQDSCPRCAATDMAAHLLPRRGRLWAWTTQEFPPPSPPYAGPAGKEFVPFSIGYVALGDEIKVESRLTEVDPDALKPGTEMELVLVPFRNDDDDEVVTFAFRPAIAGERAEASEAQRAADRASPDRGSRSAGRTEASEAQRAADRALPDRESR